MSRPAAVDNLSEDREPQTNSGLPGVKYFKWLLREPESLHPSDLSERTFTGESPNLDFLRTTAVVLVVAYHLLLFFRLGNSRLGPLQLYAIGHWGVLIFFVHTTTVLMFSLERQRNRAPDRPLLLPFLARRFFRIFPLSIFIVLMTRIFMLPVGHLHDGFFIYVPLGWRGLLANLLLLQNLTHTDSIVAPLWSLPYELQMYLVLPALFLLACYVRNWLPLLAIWIFSLFLAMNSYPIERFGVPDIFLYVPCFLPGVFAYKLSLRFRKSLPFAAWVAGLALASAFYLTHPGPKRGWLGCLVLGSLWPLCKEMSFPALQKICHTTARYSYGIYLAHFACIWLAFQGLTELPNPVRWFVFGATITAIPYLLYHALEAPLIRFGNRFSAPPSKVLKQPAISPAMSFVYIPVSALTPPSKTKSERE